jgi:hypothetical protein
MPNATVAVITTISAAIGNRARRIKLVVRKPKTRMA